MIFRAAARALLTRRPGSQKAVALGLTAMLLSGCGAMSKLGIPGVDAGLDQRFSGVCTAYRSPTAVYRDNGNGDLFSVTVNNPGSARVNGVIYDGALRFAASYSVGLNQNVLIDPRSTLGAHIEGFRSDVRVTSADLIGIEGGRVHDVAMKALRDAYYGGQVRFPDGICPPDFMQQFDLRRPLQSGQFAPPRSTP